MLSLLPALHVPLARLWCAGALLIHLGQILGVWLNPLNKTKIRHYNTLTWPQIGQKSSILKIFQGRIPLDSPIGSYLWQSPSQTPFSYNPVSLPDRLLVIDVCQNNK